MCCYGHFVLFLSTGCKPITCINMSFFQCWGYLWRDAFIYQSWSVKQVHLDLSCKHLNADANVISSASWTILWKRKWWYETRETHVTQISTHLPPTIMHQLAILETINSPFEEKLSFYCHGSWRESTLQNEHLSSRWNPSVQKPACCRKALSGCP